MQRFIFRRICILVPTVFVVLVILFTLSKLTPGDPVFFALQSSHNSTFEGAFDADSYNQKSHNLGLDLPLFYLSVIPSDIPREIYDLKPIQKKFAFDLIRQRGNGEEVIRLVHLFDDLNSIFQNKTLRAANINLLLYDSDIERTSAAIEKALNEEGTLDSNLDKALIGLKVQIDKILETKMHRLSLFPKVIWHGSENQFHDYLKKVITLDLGNSIIDGQDVWKKIKRAFSWTLVINISAILFGYIFAIIIGVYSGWWGGRFDTISSLIFYFIYSIPIFWLGTMLIVFCTTSHYSVWLNIFPSAGIWIASSGDSFWTIISRNGGQLLLPILVLSTSLMAFIARIMRNSIMEEKGKAYVLFARTKGLSERQILWNHVFKNASFPLITLFASVFPMAISGSIVLEIICNIPGSGRLLFDAIINQDWSIVFGIVLISTLLTIIGLLISDILYRWVDPRIKWSNP